MARNGVVRTMMLIGAVGLIVNACGGDDDSQSDPTEATADTAEASDTAEPTETGEATDTAESPETSEADTTESTDISEPAETTGSAATSEPTTGPAPAVLADNENCASAGGVTDDTIRIGAIVAQSGPVAGAGIPITAAITTYWDQVNEQGGIDGRQVEIVLRDDEFTPAKTATAYQEIKNDVVAVQGFGSGNVAAVAEQAVSDCLVVMGNASSGAGTLIGPTLFTGVTANEFEVVNLIDWWVNDQGNAAPKIGIAYEGTPNGFGSLSAARYAAEAFGGEIVSEQEFAPTDTSFAGQIAALQRDGADVLVVGAGNAPAYQFIAQAAQANPDWTYLGAHSIFAGDVFGLPVSEVYQDRVYVGDAAIPNYADGGPAQQVGDLVTATVPDVRVGDVAALAAWLSQELLHAALINASANGELTRGTMLNELTVLEQESTFYPGVTQSFGTDPVFPRTPTPGSGIFIADESQPGGKRTVVPYFVSDAAAGYQP